MEKQTKILLGVGAVIAAYLILKPKKAVAQTNDNSIVEGDVETKLQEELARLKLNMPIISEDERDCNMQYAMSAKQQDMPSEEQLALRQANFIKRCMEEKERTKYLIAEANRPDNVGSPAYMSPDELKIIQESYLSSRQLINPWS
jgi:hypothetical protein